jgi:hypothetical protein
VGSVSGECEQGFDRAVIRSLCVDLRREGAEPLARRHDATVEAVRQGDVSGLEDVGDFDRHLDRPATGRQQRAPATDDAESRGVPLVDPQRAGGR